MMSCAPPDWLRRAASALSMSLLAACAGLEPPGGRPDSPEGGPLAMDPAVCRIVDTRAGSEVSEASLLRRFRETRTLLLGENHDNPHHHRLRGRWLADWASGADAGDADGVDAGGTGAGAGDADDRGAGSQGMDARDAGAGEAEDARDAGGKGADARGAEAVGGVPARIVFEHLDREHDAALARAQRQQSAGPAEQWLQAARFDAGAWQGEDYRPLFDAAFGVARRHGVHWVAGNFSRASARAVMMQGAPVDPSLLALRDRADWDAAAGESLLAAVRAGHCHALPDEALGPMVAAQRLRDAALALPLQQAPGRSLLLAGNAHVDRRYGVPRYLDAARRQQALVVGFEPMPGMQAGESACPVAAADDAPQAWRARAAELRAAYDVVVFTPPPPQAVDHCAAFRAMLRVSRPGAGAPPRFSSCPGC